MEVILLDQISNLGNIGDKVSVKNGFARNYLIPQQKAVMATGENLEKFEAQRAEFEKQAGERLKSAKIRAEKLEKLTVKITSKSSEEGKLFGSITAREISDAITAAGVEVSKMEVLLADGPLRQTGEHAIKVKLHSEVSIDFMINVVAE